MIDEGPDRLHQSFKLNLNDNDPYMFYQGTIFRLPLRMDWEEY